MNASRDLLLLGAALQIACSTPSKKEIHDILQQSLFADDNVYCSVLVMEEPRPTGAADLFVATVEGAAEQSCIDGLFGAKAATALSKHRRHAFGDGEHAGWGFRPGPNATVRDLSGGLKQLTVPCGTKALIDAAPIGSASDRVDVMFTQSVRIDPAVADKLSCGRRPPTGSETRRATLHRDADGRWHAGRDRGPTEQ